MDGRISATLGSAFVGSLIGWVYGGLFTYIKIRLIPS